MVGVSQSLQKAETNKAMLLQTYQCQPSVQEFLGPTAQLQFVLA